MSKYLFFDMDGTLISPSTRHIPQSAVYGINKAMEAGHKCFICTGRSIHLAQKFTREKAEMLKEIVQRKNPEWDVGIVQIRTFN